MSEHGAPPLELPADEAPSWAGGAEARLGVLAAVFARRETAIFGVAVAMFVFFSLTADFFLTTGNVLDMARAMSYTAIVGVGMTYLFIAGELDLSVGALYGFASVLMAWLVSAQGVDVWGSFVIVLLAGLVVGLLNGGLVTLIGIPSFIVTLGMLSLLRGAALLLSGSFPIALPEGFKSAFSAIAGGSVGSVPAQIFWMLVVMIAGFVLLRFTVFGYHVYATGGNRHASRQLGIDTRRVKLACFVMTSVLGALIGALQVGWLKTSEPTTGSGFELQVIGAVIIGGTALFGGDGSVFGTLIGAAILTMLSSGLVLLGLSVDAYQLFTGLVIILAAALDLVLRQHQLARVIDWTRRVRERA